jgi:hypothetical protein
LKGDLEDQLFSISVEGLLDGHLSVLGGVPLAALFDSCVEGCETSSCYSYSLKGAILRTNPSLYPLRVSLTGNSPSQAVYQWLLSQILALKRALTLTALGIYCDSDATAEYSGLFHRELFAA